jgi:uncharacterized protein
MTRSKQGDLFEALTVTGMALCLSALVIFVKLDFLDKYAELILAAIWLYLPAAAIFINKQKLDDFAVSNIKPVKSIVWFLIASLAIFPVFYLGAAAGATKLLHLTFRLTIPAHFWPLFLGQLLLVALPEEWFFRGYFQAKMNRVFGRKWKLFGAEFGPGFFITALVFALAHLLGGQTWDRLLVFFPALVFGWLREKTGSLAAPVLFHFASNLGFIIFQMSWMK